MHISNYRSHEPLYIIMVRLADAERLLRRWSQENQAQVTIENSRMRLFDQRSYQLFVTRWSHGWDEVVIWDCWNKRHIWLN
jgi:hypothetical protein